MLPSRLAGCAALVTGAGRRLGRVIAEALAAEGADLLLHYRSSQGEAESLAETLRQRGAQAWTLRADLADPQQVSALWAAAVQTAPRGRVELLVNSAAVFPEDSLADLVGLAEAEKAGPAGPAEAELSATLRVNALAPARLGALLAAQEGLARGSVVNLLDSRMHGYMRRHVSYNLSKQALLALTRMMALQYAPRVRVNGVAPGYVLPPPEGDAAQLARLSAQVPLGRTGRAEEVAHAVVYLMQAQYVTGQVLYVDGGRFLLDGLSGR